LKARIFRHNKLNAERNALLRTKHFEGLPFIAKDTSIIQFMINSKINDLLKSYHLETRNCVTVRLKGMTGSEQTILLYYSFKCVLFVCLNECNRSVPISQLNQIIYGTVDTDIMS
jgi:hypothetical protein